MSYSERKYQVPNMKKTLHAEFVSQPTLEDLIIDKSTSISSIDLNKGYSYLNMNFIPTNDMKKIIDKNLNMKMFNVAKCYGWLENNDVIPIEIKTTCIR